MGTRDYDIAGTSILDLIPRRPSTQPIIVEPNSPARLDSRDIERWTLRPRDVGLLEAIAQAHYRVSDLPREAVAQWERRVEQQVQDQGKAITDGDAPYVRLDAIEQVIEPVAQSVQASNAIENEAIYERDMPLAIVGQPQPDDPEQSRDYDMRVLGTRAIYGAYIWALTQDYPLQGGNAVTPAFIREVHRRMFSSTRHATAGLIKTQANAITRNGEVVVHPVAVARTEEYLEAVCRRLNKSFKLAQQGGYCKLLAIAEFLVDFLAVHPFADGNGRTARLLSTYLLEKAGYHFARFYSMDIIILANRASYYDALMNSQRNWCTDQENLSPWVQFYLWIVFSQMQNAYELIKRQYQQG